LGNLLVQGSILVKVGYAVDLGTRNRGFMPGSDPDTRPRRSDVSTRRLPAGARSFAGLPTWPWFWISPAPRRDFRPFREKFGMILKVGLREENGIEAQASDSGELP
jgi:hypothetical protein